MPDLTITPAQVKVIGLPPTEQRVVASGVTVTQGQILRVDATTDEWRLAAAGISATEAEATHIALNAGSEGQPVDGALLQRGLTVDLGAGAAPVQGTLYVLSANAGNQALATDLIVNNFVTYLCTGIGSNQVVYSVNPSGAQIP